MKHKNLNQKLEEIARTHLGIDVFSKAPSFDSHEITNRQIEKALKAAYLLGEKSGYKHGFSDAKEACPCSLEEEVEEESKLPLDFLKQLV
jgi:Rad3-related DNA helicase